MTPEFARRYVALTRKELCQLKRNHKLIIQLLVPPTVLLILWGYALNPEVKNLRTAVLDYDRSPQSRELISALTEIEAFRIVALPLNDGELQRSFDLREIEAAIVIPPDLSRTLARGETARIQLLLDAVMANSAAVAAGYLRQSLAAFNRGISFEITPPGGGTGGAVLRTAAFYNPGLHYSWFYLTAVMGIVLFLDGSLVASAIAVREKEVGTMEQLLMSPAQSLEILLAKTTPPLVLINVGLLMSLFFANTLFDLPLRGSFWLFAFAGLLAAWAAMGLGILIATFSSSQQQAQFLTFFINPPLVLCAGAFSRVENLPDALRWLVVINPLGYLVRVLRAVAIKGAGIADLWQPLACLAVTTVGLYALSAWRFRKQLG